VRYRSTVTRILGRFLLFLPLLACATVRQPSGEGVPARSAEADEYAVYRTVVAPLLSHATRLVVEELTRNRDVTGLGLRPDLERAFEDANGLAVALDPARFLLDLPVSLLPDKTARDIFAHRDEDGWTVFRERYPGAQGLLTLSRVAFDASRQTAVVFVNNQSGWLAGEGAVFVLARRGDGAWVVVERHERPAR